MEEQAHLQVHHKGYCSHMTISSNKIDDTIDNKNVSKFSLTYLRTAVEQLLRKKELIHEINLQIKKLIQIPEELKDSVCEVE